MSEIAVNNDDYIRLDEESRKFAVDARGCNVLLAAAAGSGKTTTLVERIVQRIVSGESEAHIDSYLVVTFTNAAAAELRERINGRLSEIFNDAVENGDEELAKRAYRERLLLPKAMIGTIDSFCLDVVKKNFMSAGIDPVFRIDDVEAEIIISEAADEILEKYYADKDSDDYKVLIELVDVFCTIYGDDGLKENLILPVYRYSEDFPNPEEWLAMTEKNYTVDGDIQENVWYKYIKDEMRIVCADILKHIRFILDDLNSGCGRYAALTAPEKYIRIFTQDIEFFKGLAEKIDEAPDRGVLFEDIFKYKDKPPFCRTGSKAEFKTKAAHCIIKSERDKYIRYYEKISESLIDRRKDYETDESVKLRFENGVRSMGRYIKLLRRIISDIGAEADARMERRRIFSFSKVAHTALSLLCGKEISNGNVRNLVQSDAAVMYSRTFEEVYIDEYQDTSLLQEGILYLVSRLPLGENNMFMVGDVKQSIYGFRHAKPRFFIEKYRLYQEHPEYGSLRMLSRNFRSRKPVLDAVNSVFSKVMRGSVCGIDYSGGEMLNYGAKAQYDGCVQNDEENGKAELCICMKYSEKNDDEDELRARYGDELLFVVDRIIRLFEEKFTVYDKSCGGMRPLRFSDIAVITRSNKGVGKATAALREFELPVTTMSAESFFERTEIVTVLEFLRVIDNPYRDIPVAAVLRSPYYGFTDNELACIKAGVCGYEGCFYELLCRLDENCSGGGVTDIGKRVKRFCSEITYFRELSRVESVSRLLWLVINHNGFYDRCSEEEKGNLRLLLEKSYPYDSGDGAGLFGFISYINSFEKICGQKQTAYEGQSGGSDKIKVMTIHKSKGLEFPVLFLYGAAAGSGAQREKVFFSENYGMGFSFMYGGETEDNAAGGFLLRSIGESPALRVLKNESRKEELCEEQRLLYVAMTRAREKLFVTAEVSADKLEDQMSVMCGGALTPVCGDLSVKSVKSYLDMIYLAVFGKDAEESWRVRRIQGVSGRLGEENGIRRVREIKAVLSGETVLDMSDGNTCRTEKAVNTENVDNVTANSFVNIQATESPEKRQTERFLKVIEEADDGRLPAKLSVSSLKKLMYDEEGTLCSISGISLPELKKMRLPGEEDKAEKGGRATDLTSAEFGTLMHKCLQSAVKDRAAWPERTDAEACKLYAEEFVSFIHKRGVIDDSEYMAADTSMLAEFLLTQRAAEIKSAEFLCSEVPFTFLTDVRKYLDSDTNDELYVNNEKSAESAIALQGIIDLYYKTNDGIALVDFKTDKINSENAERLLQTYSVQLMCYLDALESITGMYVKEAVLLFLRTGQEYIYDRRCWRLV